MKKLLLSTVALTGLAVIATPAAAQVQLDIGGYFKGYGFYTDQDEDDSGTGDAREFDIIRNTEIHFGGETTLDNGLTVGAHLEVEADNDAAGRTNSDSFEVDESYVYFSGGWGRVNFGAEDGAAYLLQVAAPSADSNIDGIRQFVNPFNYIASGGSNITRLSVEGGGANGRRGIDYDQDIALKDDKLTYLSPIMNGFQLGLSYTPELGDDADEDAAALDDEDEDLGSVYEAALRYEGMFNNVGVILGAGYTHAELESSGTANSGLEDDRVAWNVGADFDIGPFGLGVVYTEDNYADSVPGFGAIGLSQDDEEELWVVGVDYTTGPFKLGASYIDIDNTGDVIGADGTGGVETQRYTGGVVYTYGPGMSFRGSISHIEHENVAGLVSGDELEATSLTIGTQINF